MVNLIVYDRYKAVNYARKWALSRNPEYANFQGMGGDCANFASQCLYAGIGVMNLRKNTGWYYKNLNDRSPAWSGVRFLKRFLLENLGAGPFGEIVPIEKVLPGDIIFLGQSVPYHCLVIVKSSETDTLIAAHTYDAWLRSLYSYNYNDITPVQIKGGHT